MTEPSARLMSFAVRTTTAFITSPFLTRPRGMASLTETTITSPTLAYFRFEPPSTLMHITRRAPELSATSRFVCICIIVSCLSFQAVSGSSASRTAPVRYIHPGGEPHSANPSLPRLCDSDPSLLFRDRARFLDCHCIPALVLSCFLMRVLLLGPPPRLLQERMREPA